MGASNAALENRNDSRVGAAIRLIYRVEIVESGSHVQSDEWKEGGLRESESVFAVEADVGADHVIKANHAKSPVKKGSGLASGIK